MDPALPVLSFLRLCNKCGCGQASQCAYRRAPGTAHATTEPQKEGRVGDVAHGDVGDGNVFEQSTINCLQRQAATIVKDAIRNHDVLEPAVGLGAKLDSAGRTADIVSVVVSLERPIKKRAFVIAADLTVGDGDVLGRARITKRERALRANSIVKGRVDCAIRNPDVAAGINVDAVAVSVDLQIVDGEVVDAGGENCKVAAMQDRNITNDDVATE